MNDFQIFNSDEFERMKSIENTIKSSYLGFIYFLEYGENIKIGYSQKPSNRMKQLKNQAEYGKIKLGNVAISKPHTNYRENEKLLHQYFNQSRIAGTELFSVTLKQILSDLPKDLKFLDESEKLEQESEERFKFIMGILFPKLGETESRISCTQEQLDHVENLHITQKKEVFLMQEKNNSTPAQKKSSKRQKIGERTHIYRNADGSIFGKKVVNKFSDGSKNAVWYLFNLETNNFNQIAGLSGAIAPLYNADVLYHNKDNAECPIIIVEGEKDVETLAIMEILATSLPNGGQSKQWHDELYNDGLQGHDIIILTDNDKTGETYGENVAKNVSRIARSVKIVPAKAIWSECPEKGDISDIAKALGQDKTIELLLDAIKKTEYYVDISDFEELINDAEVFPKQKIKYSVIQLSKVEPETQEFLWNPYIPIGELTIMYAAGGTGKSFATVGIASDITAGRTLPIYGNQQVATKPERVLFISAEDNESIIFNRMREARGNPDNCYVMQTPKTRKELDTESFLLPQNKDDIVRIQALADLLEEIHPKLVIIDPWSVYIGDDKNMNKANDVRGVTNVLTVLAKEFHCAILIVAHVNKMPQTENANNAVSGSTALIDSSRSALCVRSFGADSDRRIILQTKSNYQKKAKSVCYRIINQGENKTACFEWDGFSDLTEDDLTKSARTGKSLSDIENDNSADEENKEVAIEVIKRLAVYGQSINISYDRFREELKDECGEDFLPQKPTRFMNSLISDLKYCGIRIELKRVRGILKDGSKDIETKRGFVISNMTDGHLMASAMPK
ncbi:MAG: AAA family ATPase [Ruminococcus sp.]|nr:AAA family ATPase [Ruminococcus sp.]